MEYNEKFAMTDVALAYLLGRDPKTDMGGNSTGFYMECQGSCDAERLEKAINGVIERQPMLRSVLFADGTQAELKEIPMYKLPVRDLTGFSAEETERFFDDLREEKSHKIFPLGQWPMFEISLYKLNDNCTRTMISFDMMLVDRFSIELLIYEMSMFYNGREDELPPLSHSYSEYIELYNNERAANYDKDKAYWENLIPDMPLAPTVKIQPGDHSGGRFDTLVHTFSEEEYGKLKDALYEERILPSVYMMYCYGKALSRFGSCDKLSVSMTMAARSVGGQIFSDVIGDFTKLLLVDLDTNGTWLENCRALQKRIRDHMKHSDFTGLDVMKEIARREQLGGKAAFPFAFTSRLTSEDTSYWDFLGNMVYRISRTPQLAVDCQISELKNKLEARWDYLIGTVEQSLLENMFAHYIELVANEYRNVSVKAGIPYKEIEKYNSTHMDIPQTCLQSIMKDAYVKFGDRPALSVGDKTFTYKEFRSITDKLASAIYKRYGSGNTIMVEGSRTYKTVMLITSVVRSGNAYVPFDSKYPQKRIDSIRSSCRADAVLENRDMDLLLSEGDEGFEDIISRPDDLAYIIFTSGSTGTPKGVVITHGAVCNTIIDINRRFTLTEKDCIIGISSFWFDLSVYDLFGAFSAGAHLVLNEKVDAEHISALMNKYPVTFWNTVPAIMGLLVSSGLSVPAENMRNVLLSGDWIPLELPEKIQSVFPKADIYSLGGATEASIWSIYYPIKKIDPKWSSIPYGYPLANQSIYILNNKKELCPIGVQGEICIGGVGVALEYCGSPNETSAHYIQHEKFGRLYLTGDQGCYSPDGYVVFMGRNDQQVKIHGFRIELGEIEAALLKDKNVENALAAAVKNEKGAVFIVAYTVCRDHSLFDEKAILKTVSENVPEYMVPSIIIDMPAFPLTPNGKIDRKSLPKPDIQTDESESPQTDTERIVATIWEKILKTDNISRDDNFLYLGGDSLLAITAAGMIKTNLGKGVDAADVLSMPVLKEFCDELDRRGKDNASGSTVITVGTLNEGEPFPLNAVQRSYWIGANGMKSMSGVTTHAMCEVECEKIDTDRLEQAFNKLIDEQDMMRAVILNDGTQKILPRGLKYDIVIRDCCDREYDSVLAELRLEMEHERFVPDKWPLFRVEGARCGDKITLFVDLDNMIFDGYSVNILFDRWADYYYTEQETRRLSLSFGDYVKACEEMKGTDRYNEDKMYWQEQVKAMKPAPELTVLSPPESIVSQTVSHIQNRIPHEKWENFKDMCRKNEVTPSSALLTVYAYMLSLWSRRSEFTINLTLYNRLFEHPEINEIIGDFTLLTMFSADMSGNKSFSEYSKQVQKKLFENMAHPYYGGVEVQQDYIRLNNHVGTAFPVVFTSTVGMNERSGDKKSLGRIRRITTETPQVWLDCQVTEIDGQLNISFEAVKELFGDGMPERASEFYSRMIGVLADSPISWENKVSDVIYDNMMIPTLAEREKLSEIPPVDGENTLEKMFAVQAFKTPDKPAVIDRERTVTYRELYCEAYKLSRDIRRNDVKTAAVFLKKGWRQAVAVLGTIMAGAAYLPLDIGNPDSRISEILSKSETSLIITENEYIERAEKLAEVCIPLEPSESTADMPLYEPCSAPDDTAYIIFTSGSTGKPKGVVITHRGAVNTIIDVNKRFDICENDRTIAVSALNFDLSVYDIFGMVCFGGCVVIPSEADRKDPMRLAQLMIQHGVTVWNSVPAYMQMLADNADMSKMTSLRIVMLSGDWIPLSLPDKIRAYSSTIELYSLGGATEASIWSNYYPIGEITEGMRSVPYGYPLSGQGFRILNESMIDCPPMTIGKLYISGTGLAKGYLNDEALTSERFITLDRTGERLYDTGDLGMYWNDGTMEFFGREDFQVKIRGHRIELGEIEAALTESKAVDEAAAFTVKHSGRTFIAAAVISDKDEDTVSDSVIKAAEDRLPGYMVPSVVVVLSSFPLTANGKIDRKTLVGLAEEKMEKQHENISEEQMDETEKMIAGIWQEILEQDEVPGLHEDFFDFGGDSMDIVRVRTKLSEISQRDIEMSEIFEDPTISGMAKLIR